MASPGNDNINGLNAIGKLLGKLSTKAVPTWDISEKGQSIKSHIRRFENAVGGNLEMTETEKAREFAATMRGQAAVYVDELKEEIRTDYTKLKEELLATFHKEKSVNVLMKEFHNMKWRKNKQTIREFAAVLNIAWRKISGADKKGDEKDAAMSEAILKNRLLDAIKEAAPKFGTGLEFYITDSTKSFKDLASLAETKYDLYLESNERLAESEWDGDYMFLNSESTKREREQDQKPPSLSTNSGQSGNINQSGNSPHPNHNRFNGKRESWENRNRNGDWSNGSGRGYRDQRHYDNPRQLSLDYNQRRFEEFLRDQASRFAQGFDDYQRPYNGYQNRQQNNRYDNRRSNYNERFDRRDDSRPPQRQQNRERNQRYMNPDRTHGTVVKRTENVNFLEGKESSKNL